MATGTHAEDVEAQIIALRAAQREAQTHLQTIERLVLDALDAQARAQGAELHARAAVADARDTVQFYAGEIDLLIEEYRRLVPPQRGPGD